jgi:hypothetical protein
MATLVVGGVTVNVQHPESQQQREPVGGEIVRMFDGSARSTVRSFKRTLHVTTRLYTGAERTTLLAQLLTTTLPVSCSGDLLGGTVNCIPRMTEDVAVNVAGGPRWRISFDLVEA